ncbi:MAG: cytochrome c oxidase subunit 3 [Lysobacterales bacterium]
MAHTQDAYYVPHSSRWPIFGSVSLFLLLFGAANFMNGAASGGAFLALGAVMIIIMLFGWFGDVIREHLRGLYNAQVDVSFRQGMAWFIFSEVMFFAAFFGALFYARTLSVPWLGGVGDGFATNQFLWSDFTPAWPTNGPAEVGGRFSTIPAWGIPLLNTMILLTSGLTITAAHWALKVGKRGALIGWLAATVALGGVFLYFQVYEYMHAYSALNLTLGSGVYGSTFFMLTGFHGMHVTLGAIMLTVILGRSIAGHFTKDNHFAFEAVAWYWHFVDVVWLGLFIFVYVL